MTKEKTFMKITNRDIYDKLEKIEVQCVKTNGTVRWHTKAIYGLVGAGTIIIGWMINLSLRLMG